jgi:hypothetical protein
MFQHKDVLKTFALLAALGITGCAGMDRMGSKLDMVSGHLEDSRKPDYEGRLEAARTIGSMTSIQFADGRFFDVLSAPAALHPGDIVRIYKVSDGYEARLWHATENQPVVTGGPQTTSSTRRGS